MILEILIRSQEEEGGREILTSSFVGGVKDRRGCRSYARSNAEVRKLSRGAANTGCVHAMVFRKDNAKDSKYTNGRDHFAADTANTS